MSSPLACAPYTATASSRERTKTGTARTGVAVVEAEGVARAEQPQWDARIERLSSRMKSPESLR